MRWIVVTSALLVVLVNGPASPALASSGVTIGPLHSVQSSFETGDGTVIACPPGKPVSRTTCYLVGDGPGGTPPPGAFSGSIDDYTNEIVPILDGNVGTPVDFPGTESASVIACPGGAACETAGHVTGTTAAVFIPIIDGQPGDPVAVASSEMIVWQAISCSSVGNCVAVGYERKTANSTTSQGLIADLTKGSSVTESVVKSASQVNGVSCSSATTCVAVGQTSSAESDRKGLYMTLTNGKPGTIHVLSGIYGLNSVACGWTKRECVTTGETTTGAHGVLAARVLLHGGKATTVLPAPSILFSGYVCPKTADCVGFGVVDPNEKTEHAVVATTTGGVLGPEVTVPGGADVYSLACTELGSCTGIVSQLGGSEGDYSLSAFTVTY